MGSYRSFSVVVLVLGVGLLAALPFRRAAPEASSPSDEYGQGLALRLAAPHSADTAALQTSPAAELAGEVFDGAPGGRIRLPEVRQRGLDHSGEPPSLSNRYRPFFIPLEGELPDANAVAPRPRIEAVVPASGEQEEWKEHAALRAAHEDTVAEAAPAETPRVAKAREEPRLVKHRLRDGDSLDRLAMRYLGSAERRWEIFEANRGKLIDPELLPVGMELEIWVSE